MVTRRSFLQGASGLCLPGLFACASPTTPLNIASHLWPGYEFMTLAKDEGWLDSHKVSLIPTPSAVHTLKAITDGTADGGALTLDEVLRARSQGIDLAVVLVFDISAGADAVLARPPLAELKQLRGKRLGYEEDTVSSLLLHEALRSCGLSLADISPVEIQSPAHLSAWKAGEIDALVTFEPTVSQLIALGANRIFDSRHTPNLIVDVLAIRRDIIRNGQHELAIRHLISAHFRALRHLNTNPRDAFFRMSSRLGLPPEKVPLAYRGLLLPDLQNNLRLLLGSDRAPAALLGSTQQLASLMISTGLLPPQNQPYQLVNEFLQPQYLPLHEVTP